MSIKARNAILITILILLFSSALGFITFSGFGCGKQPEPQEQDGYNVNFYTTVDVGTGESVALFLSVDGGATYNQYVIQSPDDNVGRIFTNVKTISFYFAPSNPDNVASAVLNVGDEQFNIASATSASTAFTKEITQNTDVEPEIAVVNTYTVSAEATMRRVSGSVGGLLFVSINGGEFEQFADLTADDVGTSKVINDEFEKVYAIAFYYTPNDDSVLRYADYIIDGGIGEDFALSNSPETATVFEPTSDCTIEFELNFRPFGYSFRLNQLTSGNVSSGVSISIDGGTFLNFYGNQDNVLIEQYATTIDFYFIYDAATVDAKTAVYFYYVDDEEFEVSFVNSTHDNPVHMDLTADYDLITDTYANIAPAGYNLTFKFTSEMTEQYYGSSFFASAKFPQKDFITLTFTGTGETKTTTENLFFEENIISSIAFNSGSYDAGACSPETLKYTIDGTDPKTSPTAVIPQSKTYINNLSIFDNMTLWVYYSFWERD